MNRFLLDTNIVIFMLTGEDDNLSREVSKIFTFYPQLYVSSISIIELFQLFDKKKFKSKIYPNKKVLLKGLTEDLQIKVLDFDTPQLNTYTEINPIPNHNDPFDFAIIAHAISNKLTLISSDHSFSGYQKQGLDFVFNKR